MKEDTTAAREEDPLDEVLEHKQKLAAARNQKDLELWQQWRQNPTPENMDNLMGRFDRDFKNKSRMWKAPNVNDAAFITTMRLSAADAFQNYNPNKGASLRTYLNTRLQRAKRFNTQHQNYATMSEQDVNAIGKIHRAQDELMDQMGRAPSPAEITNHVNKTLPTNKRFSPKRVQRVIEGQRKDIIGSTFESDPTPHAIQREREVARLLRPELSSEQQQVFDYLYGKNGKPQINSTTRLAQKLGKNPSQVSRLRSQILQKFDEFM